MLASRTGGFDDSRGDDVRMSGSDSILLKLAWNDLLNLMLETQSNSGDFFGGDGAGDIVCVGGEQSAGFVNHARRTIIVAIEHGSPLHDAGEFSAALQRIVAKF